MYVLIVVEHNLLMEYARGTKSDMYKLATRYPGSFVVAAA